MHPGPPKQGSAFPQGGRGIYTGSAGSRMEIFRPQKPAKKDIQNRKRHTKGNKIEHQATWRNKEPEKRGGVHGWLAGPEQAGGHCESEGEDGGKVTTKTACVLPEPWVKKQKQKPPYHPCLPIIEQHPREWSGTGKRGAACTVELSPWWIPKVNEQPLLHSLGLPLLPKAGPSSAVSYGILPPSTLYIYFLNILSIKVIFCFSFFFFNYFFLLYFFFPSLLIHFFLIRECHEVSLAQPL